MTSVDLNVKTAAGATKHTRRSTLRSTVRAMKKTRRGSSRLLALCEAVKEMRNQECIVPYVHQEFM